MSNFFSMKSLINLWLLAGVFVVNTWADNNKVQRLAGETYNDTVQVVKESEIKDSTEAVKPGESTVLNRNKDKRLGISKTAFDHKVLFVDRPSEGKLWQSYYRNTTFLANEFGIDLKFVRVDYLTAGLRNFEIKENNSVLDDYFTSFTISSPMFEPNWLGDSHKLIFGLKSYKEYFRNQVEGAPEEDLDVNEIGTIFLSQSFAWDEDIEAGLYISSGGDGDESEVMWSPWIQSRIKKTNWYLAGEYYYTNVKTLPLKFLQYGFDVDKLEFYNPSREWVSWMNYGIKYAGEDFYFAFSLMNHYSFVGAKVPLLSFGYEF